MEPKELTVRFDLDKEKHKRVYYALMNLPGYYDESDLSEAVIRFIDDLVASMTECEDRAMRCKQMLSSLLGGQAAGRVEWQ